MEPQKKNLVSELFQNWGFSFVFDVMTEKKGGINRKQLISSDDGL
jgi:hypothetical protein